VYSYIILYFFVEVTCCCDLEICTHFYFYVFYDFFFRHSSSPSSPFSQHLYTRSMLLPISKLLSEVSVLIIKICFRFFMASLSLFSFFFSATAEFFVLPSLLFLSSRIIVCGKRKGESENYSMVSADDVNGN